MLGWIYLAGCVLALRPFFRFVADYICGVDAEWIEVIGAVFITLCFSLLWFLIVGPVLIKKAIRAKDPNDFIRKVGGESKADKLTRLEAANRELERQLEIR